MMLHGGVVRLKPSTKKPRGYVLISYTTLPFTGRKSVLGGHTNQWECQEIARSFLDKGYEVDVIDATNTSFTPTKRYAYLVDIGSNMERLAPQLPHGCIKIFHATTSYWKYQNEAEEKRIEAIFSRRGTRLTPRRKLEATRAFELADAVSLLGNDCTKQTYPPGKPITLIPISTTHQFPLPQKNYDRIRKNFLWFGGSGMAHKGLDLVLEAFAQMPDYALTIVGKIENERDFVDVYNKELYKTHNIKLMGPLDPGGDTFNDIIHKSLALVYPSSSEGQSGAVVLTMHAGLIPIVSRESGVPIQNFGIVLKENTVEEIKKCVVGLSQMPSAELQKRSREAWHYAKTNHTRQAFTAAYQNFIEHLESSPVV